MALGTCRDGRQHDLWVASAALTTAPVNSFYDKLKQLLRSICFDDFVEEICEPITTDETKVTEEKPCIANAARWWNVALPTCAPRAARGELGYGGSSTSTNNSSPAIQLIRKIS